MAVKDIKPEPWERQPGESAKAYEYFCAYRDMEERSLRKVAYDFNKSVTNIGKFSSKYEWVERTTAWDVRKDEEARKQQLKDIKNMRKRHADLATQMLLKATMRLKNMPLADIEASDISRMVDVASKLERLSRGDSGEVVEQRDGGKAPNAVEIYQPVVSLPDNNRDGSDEDEE